MNADEIVKFDRKKSDWIFTETLNDLDNLNSRDRRFEYADYVTLHNDMTALYDSFSYVDEIIESLQAQLTEAERRERAAVEARAVIDSEYKAAYAALLRIQRDLKEPDKIFIHLSDYFGWRGPQETEVRNDP